MDPKDKFKERYNEYLSERNKQIAVKPSSITPASPKGRSYSPNKFYVLGIIVGLLIVGPTAAYLILSNQIIQNTTPSHISSVNVPPVSKITVTDAQIDTEMQKIWGQYYDQTKNDPKLRESAKQIIVRRNLIQSGIIKNNLDMSSIASDNPIEKEQQTESTLSKKVLSWRDIDYAYVFVDPTNPKYQSYPEQIKYSYNLIRTSLSKENTFKQAYETAKNDPKFFKPITVSYNKLFYKKDWDKDISNKLFTYKKGQNTNIIAPPGGVFIIAHINDSNDTPYATLEEWTAAQK